MLIILLIALSCRSDKAEKEQLLGDLAQRRMIFTKYTVSHFGETQYLEFYKTVNDTLQSWIENELTVSKMQRFSNWKLDSLMCFNMSKNKCVMAIVNQESETVNNSINFLYGAKIKKNGIFFYGPTKYPDPSNHTTLSFSKLHEIAMDNIFKGYLKKGKGGKWEINERFFARFYERDAYNFPFTTQEAWEESWLKLMRENWKNRDTTNYRPLQ